MAKLLKLRRGTDTQHSTFTGAEGEVTVNTTNDSLHVHDGTTAGGTELAKADLSNVSGSLSAISLDNTNITILDDGVSGGSVGINVDGTGVFAADATLLVPNVDTILADNLKVKFGTGSDLEIYHNGSNSFVDNIGGYLYIRQTADDADIHLQSDDGSGGNADYVVCNGSNGAVQLYHYGTQKLATTSTGLNVTGDVAVSGTVDGRDVAADGTKLDGIETGATADQTKADIDALNINADQVDGLEASQFIRADASDSYTGGLFNGEETITAGVGGMNLENGHFWTCGAITIPLPTNGAAGFSGLIRVTAAPTFATGWDFPGGAYTAPTAFPAVAPFYIVDSSTFLLGNWTEGIA